MKVRPASTSQQKVGTLRTRRNGRSSGAWEIATDSAAPRAGSRIMNMNTASNSPGTAAIKNGARQLSKACTIAPIVKNASNNPNGSPSMKMPMARARRSAGNRSPISELAAGA
ncbi:hypothetical protein D3C79_705520 [compost metagenome]